MVSPGGYTEAVILSFAYGLQPNGEFVTLNSTAPSGITVSYNPSSPVALLGSKTGTNVTLIVSAGTGAAVGNDTIKVTAVSGQISQSVSFTLSVVQYRIVMLHSAYIPKVMNVSVGSTVYWQNLDGPAGGCGAVGGAGVHSVVFTTLTVNSSKIQQFGIFSYTFTTPGSYFYYSSADTDHVMNGTINVAAAGGGVGMAPRMPTFSYFKGGTPAEVASHSATEKPSSVQPIAVIAAGSLVLSGLVLLSIGSPTLSGVGVDASVVAFFGLFALALALAASSESKRRMTELGVSVAARILPE